MKFLIQTRSIIIIIFNWGIVKTLESFLACKVIKLMLKLKPQYFGNLMQRANFLEKTLMLGKTEGERRREQQRMK